MTEIGADQSASSFAELDRQPARDRVPSNRFFEIYLGKTIEPHKLKRRDPNAKLVANLFERVIGDDVDLVDREIELTRDQTALAGLPIASEVFLRHVPQVPCFQEGSS